MKPQIGLQLYTLRDQLADDFSATIQRVAAIGYQGVETAFFANNMTPKEAKRQFEDLGLAVTSAHCPLPLGGDQVETLSLLDDLNCKYAVWHGWPQDERYNTLDGIRKLADIYNEAYSVIQKQDIRFGLHNHWWEFEPVENSLPYEVLCTLLHPDIFFEFDTYWIQTARQNPATVVAGAGTRAPLLHIKDGPATRNDDMVAVGAGSLDIPAIVRASQNCAEWLIVEMDSCSGDIWQALEQSYRYLTESDFVLTSG